MVELTAPLNWGGIVIEPGTVRTFGPKMDQNLIAAGNAKSMVQETTTTPKTTTQAPKLGR